MDTPVSEWKHSRMDFHCPRCGKTWTDLKMLSREGREIVQKHMFNLCTPAGRASAEQMRMIFS